MFSPDIVESDAFLDMPSSSQALYFHLGMNADDDGFVNPKRVMRMVGVSDDDLKVLIGKRFVLIFENGVIVIKHWKINNLVRKDWYKETQYIEQKKQLKIKENGAYTELVNEMLTVRQHRLGKVRLGNISDSSESGSTVPLTDNKEDMGFNNKSDNDDDLPSIGDDGEVEETDQEKHKKENAKVITLMEWAEVVRKKKFLDKPTQIKHIKLLKAQGISPAVIKDTFTELIHSDYWKGQDRLPDFKTVVSSLKNKK